LTSHSTFEFISTGSATFLHLIGVRGIFLKELEMQELREKLNIGIPQEILELERRLEAFLPVLGRTSQWTWGNA